METTTMNLPKRLCLLTVIPLLALQAQGQPPLTKAQLVYYDYVLMTLSNLDLTSHTLQVYENGVAAQFGLNSQELSTMHAIVQDLRNTLQQIRQSEKALAGSQSSALDRQTLLTGLRAQRSQAVETLANRLMNSVRPEVANRILLFANQNADVIQGRWKRN
jgi:hypothetical protein